jgi:hypothetical protein
MNIQAVINNPFTLRMLGVAALTEKLGIAGAAEFLRQNRDNPGQGRDYAKDRHAWLDLLTFEEICGGIEEIERKRVK